MEYTRLGRTGLEVSQLCLGTMNFGWSADEATSLKILDTAFEAGINFLDTANVYSKWVEGNQGGESETVIGKWLKTKNRRQVTVATKVRGRMWEGANGEGLNRNHIIHAAEDSLQRLQTDYIDLYQAHWFDNNTPLDETLSAFDHLIQSGKVRYIGCSNYPAWLLMKACWVADAKNLVRYNTLQPHYSLFHRKEFEAELAEVCIDQQIAVIPYSPLAAGFATGKYTRDDQQPETARSDSSLIKQLTSSDEAFDALDILREIAAAHDAPPAQIALAWLLNQPSVTAPIIGARTVEQLEDLLGVGDIQLSQEDMLSLHYATEDF